MKRVRIKKTYRSVTEQDRTGIRTVLCLFRSCSVQANSKPYCEGRGKYTQDTKILRISQKYNKKKEKLLHNI